MIKYLILSSVLVVSMFFGKNVCETKKQTNVTYLSGIDISKYQGNIDWNLVDTTKVKFVFIKSSEGSSHKDRMFRKNLNGALSRKIRTSAYHRFSISSSGSQQFKNYSEIVPVVKGMLPPSIDLLNLSVCPEERKVHVIRELKVFTDLLKKRYGKSPIFYLNGKIQYDFIKDNFNDNTFWLLKHGNSEPYIFQNQENQFWQHSTTGRIKGINGNVDMNYFKGTVQDLQNL